MLPPCLVRIGAALVLALPLLAQFDVAATVRYAAEPISIGLNASAMNNRGWIVGYNNGRPARYRPGVGTEILTSQTGVLTDINDAGTAVGYFYTAGQREAVIRPAGASFTRLGFLGGTYSEALAINEAGQVVGWSNNSRGQERPFIYTEATGMQMLADVRGRAAAINEAGQVTGTYRAASGWSSFLWDPVLGFIDIEDDPSVTVDFRASKIADNGLVIGQTGRGMATFSLDEGLRIPSGLTFGVLAAAVNDRGWVVGCDPCQPNLRPKPAIYIYGQGNRDLNTLLVTPLPQPLTHGIDINDRDEILALVETVGYYLLKRVP